MEQSVSILVFFIEFSCIHKQIRHYAKMTMACRSKQPSLDTYKVRHILLKHVMISRGTDDLRAGFIRKTSTLQQSIDDIVFTCLKGLVESGSHSSFGIREELFSSICRL
jgi:hypothetical protein